MRLTLVTAALLLASHGACANPKAHDLQRRDFASSIKSFFDSGDDDDDGPTSSRGKSKTATRATTTKKGTTTVATTSNGSLNPSPTRTSTDSVSATSTINTSTITASATLTSTPTPTPTPTSAPVNPQPPPVKSGPSISPAGIAVAIIFSVVILLIIAWLTFRYHPKCRAWWLARQEEKYKQRSYRDNLDGAGGAGLTRGRAGLQSFFQPKRGVASQPSIKRKTIHWGAPNNSGPDVEHGALPMQTQSEMQTRGINPNRADTDVVMGAGVQRAYSNSSTQSYPRGTEKVPLAELASPMGMEPARRYDVSPLMHSPASNSSASPMSPISPVSRSGTERGRGGLSASPSIVSQMPGSVARPGRASKALPQVKVNGQVIYELA